MNVLSFVNGGTSTSFQVEISAKINEITDANVELASFYDFSLSDVDPDVREMNITIHPLGATSRLDLKAYRRLRSLLSDFDILHTHYNSVGSIGRLAAIGTDTKIINTEHNDHRHWSVAQNAINSFTYPLINIMVLNSQSTLDSLQWYEKPFLHWSESKIIHNGIDFDRIDMALERSDIPELPDGPKIITASTITDQKNLRTLVRAMESVLSDIPEAKLIIVGDGPKKDEVEGFAHQLGIENAVYFLGFLPEREQVYGTIEQCDVFVVPSIYEGFCNAAVEAMGCGLPIVASDISVLREVVGDTGIFADPNSHSEFADKIESLLSNFTHREKMSNQARIRSSSKFSIEKSAREYYELYKNLV